MTQETKATESKKVETKTVLDDMDQRRFFATTDEATAYISECATLFADFSGYPVAAAGLTDDGNFDPEIYNDSMRVGVYVLTKREGGPNSTKVHCIVIAPAPKVTAILGLPDDQEFDNAAGFDWLSGIIEKEINHVTVRALRKAENVQEIADAVDSMPTTLADFITSSREATSGILETYNSLWQAIKKTIGGMSKPFALMNLSKKELRKAMESASYAAAVYPQLETRKNKKGEQESLFVVAANFGIILAREGSMDPTIFERMLSNRDEVEIEVATDEADEFDLEAMAAKLAKESNKDAAPAVEGEPESGDDADAEEEISAS